MRYSEKLLAQTVLPPIVPLAMGGVQSAGGSVLLGLFLFGTASVGAALLQVADSDSGEAEGAEIEEISIPVRRNLVCFCVCSFALWIGTSQSLHKSALSCWQNRKALFS